MSDMSLKGIARRYRGIMGGFSVVGDIFRLQGITGSVSLRSKLEYLAREEYSFSATECIFGWEAAFEQTWSHIRIRIRLNPDEDILYSTMNTCRNRWQYGIQRIWSNQWGCGRSGELPCSLTFEAVWVDTNEHHTVRVNTGRKCRDAMNNPRRCRTNLGRWHTADSANVAAHEYGHMLGLVDEYSEDPPCPDRSPVNTGTIMDDNSVNIPSRMMTSLANNIASNVVAI